ncbi:MAG: methyltransferase domain-containing protein [Candidatus Altiarchaeales archaeon]|nr:methyltransferase domain-containing protein [Candidatus Altiarchaeales archaeon]MBD3416251.1 methyltransferase domain-containing protein [Candidatus Altiarchaeales archaeon]
MDFLSGKYIVRMRMADDVAGLSCDHNFQSKHGIWKVLCRDFLQGYVPADSTVLDVGSGAGAFINNITARRKIAVDKDERSRQHLSDDVEFLHSKASDIRDLDGGSVDVVFISNVLEHLTRDEIVKALLEAKRLLRPGGSLLILQPNIRFCSQDYWMFFDHITPLDDRALKDLLETQGYTVTESIDRFLPYTTQSTLPQSPLLMRIYLKLRFLWLLFGAQTFIKAEKK